MAAHVNNLKSVIYCLIERVQKFGVATPDPSDTAVALSKVMTNMNHLSFDSLL